MDIDAGGRPRPPRTLICRFFARGWAPIARTWRILWLSDADLGREADCQGIGPMGLHQASGRPWTAPIALRSGHPLPTPPPPAGHLLACGGAAGRPLLATRCDGGAQRSRTARRCGTAGTAGARGGDAPPRQRRRGGPLRGVAGAERQGVGGEGRRRGIAGRGGGSGGDGSGCRIVALADVSGALGKFS